jgi:starch synthase
VHDWWHFVKPLKILYCTSELAPLFTTGGLGDVAAALPKALRAQGHDVRIVMPLHRSIPQDVRGDYCCMVVADLGAKSAWGGMRASVVPGTDIPLYLVEHDGYFNRDVPYSYGAYEYEDNAERFCFFSLALLHGVSQTGWRPDIVHCHDWHTAAVPAFIKTRLANTSAWRGMPTLFTIHNLAFQGRYSAQALPYTGLSPSLFTPDCLEFYGEINIMKAGIAFASRLNTVSPRYAKEIQTPEYGQGLDGFLRTRAGYLDGILNGVDYTHWSPRADEQIAATYSLADLSGKAACKAALQRELGLPESNAPLFAMVSRLSWQKGIDLLIDALRHIMPLDIQLVILGTGDAFYENQLRAVAPMYHDKMRVIFGFNVGMSHRIEAGADFFLMPSHFEPCGLSQMYSLAYGTIPIVRETGGLADSVWPITKENLAKGTATGILFQAPTPEGFAVAIHQAMELYRYPAVCEKVRVYGMRQDFSWERSSRAYVDTYRKAIARP